MLPVPPPIDTDDLSDSSDSENEGETTPTRENPHETLISTSTAPRDPRSTVADRFEDLGDQFHLVLDELSTGGTVGRFRDEYNRLSNAVHESRDLERRLQAKVAENERQIESNATRVESALELSVDDQNTIYQLKAEVKRAWEIVEDKQDKEKRASSTISKLTTEMTSLSSLVDRGMGLEQQRKKDKMIELMSLRDEARKTLSGVKEKVCQVQNRITEAEAAIVAAKLRRREEIVRLKKVQDRVSESHSNIKREQENNQKASRTLRGKRAMLDKKRNQILEVETQQQALKREKAQRRQELEDEMKRLKEFQNRLIEIHIAMEELEQRINERVARNVELDRENKKRENALSDKKRELLSIQTLLSRANDRCDVERTHVHRLEDRIRDAEGNRYRISERILDFEREVEEVKQRIEELREQKSRLEYEKNCVSRGMVLTAERVEEVEAVRENIRQDSEMLRAKFIAQSEAFERQKQEIILLKKKRERQSERTNRTKLQFRERQQRTKMIRLENSDLQKQLIEMQNRLKDSSASYESVRRERNQYSKSYVDCQEQVSELKKKYAILSKQIKHLREGILISERLREDIRKRLAKGELDIAKVKEEKDRHAEVLQTLKAQIRDVEVKREKLERSVAQSDAERRRQLKRLREMAHQRDVLGMQLIRRNDELALLNEKLRVQERFLDAGRVEYHRRVEECRFMRIAIRDVSRTLCVQSKAMEGIQERETKVQTLTTQLTAVRKRVRALSEILQDPSNKTRWRTLTCARRGGRGGPMHRSNLTTLELGKKIHSLQTRLIKKTGHLVNTELEIARKRRLRGQLVEIMKNQPDPKLARRLNVLQNKLRHTTAAMKAKAAEMNYLNFSRREKQFEIERQARLVSEFEKQFYQVRRRQSAEEQRRRRRLRRRQRGSDGRSDRFVDDLENRAGSDDVRSVDDVLV